MSRDYTKYDGYLNSLGVLFHPDPKPQTKLLPRRPVKQDTGNNPNEIRPEYGDFFAQNQFHGGEGQEKFHGPKADPTKFYRSFGFALDPDQRLVQRNAVTQIRAESLTGVTGSIEMADSGALFVARANDLLISTDYTNWATENPHAGEASTFVLDLAAEGDRMFAALAGNGIHVRSSAGVWSHYQVGGTNVTITGGVGRVAWLKDRLMAINSSGSSTIHEVTTAAPPALQTLPEGWVFEDMFELGSYIYAVARNTSTYNSRIFHFGLSANGTTLEVKGSTPMPRNYEFYSGVGYLGYAFLVGKHYLPNTLAAPTLFQCQPDSDGYLHWQKIAEGKSASLYTPQRGAIAAIDTGVICDFYEDANPYTTTFGGQLAEFDAATGRFLHSYRQPSGTPIKTVHGIVAGVGVVFFTTEDGVYKSHNTQKEPTATLVTSVADWYNAGLKIWDQIQITCKPNPAGATIQVYYSTKHPDENTWTLAGTISTTGSEGDTFVLSNVTSRILALKIVCNRGTDTSTAPTLLTFSVRSNPKPSTTEWIIQRTIRIVDSDRKDGKAPRVLQDPDAVLESIEDLAYTPITFYEDRATWTVKLEDIQEIEPNQPLVNATGGQPKKNAYLVTLTMVGTRN